MAPMTIVRSLHCIERARLRIEHQKIAVRKLGFDGNAGSASLAQEMLDSMEGRLAGLLRDHARLIANENLLEVSA